jgi:catechol 2,3-dioxygenase-like lactoylglutathione lyase family enzyme
MLKGIEHVGLSVSDLDRSIAFYCEKLGLKLVRRLDFPSDSRIGELNGMPSSAAKVAHLESEKAMLELFEYVKPRGKPIPSGAKQADNGYIHMGFTSSDTRADYVRLSRNGVEFFGEPVELRPNVWIAYFRGPDGEVCELRQV